MATTCTKCGRRVTRVYGDGTGCYSRGDLDCERALTASLRTQLAAATERYSRAVALHEEVMGRLCERLVSAVAGLESVSCLAGEGPDVYATEKKPLIDLVMLICREALAALAAARKEVP